MPRTRLPKSEDAKVESFELSSLARRRLRSAAQQWGLGKSPLLSVLLENIDLHTFKLLVESALKIELPDAAEPADEPPERASPTRTRNKWLKDAT